MAANSTTDCPNWSAISAAILTAAKDDVLLAAKRELGVSV